MIELKEYSEKMLQLVSEHYHVDELNKNFIHAVLGVSTETAELLEALHLRKIDRVNIIEEIGDIIWYLNLVFQRPDFVSFQCFYDLTTNLMTKDAPVLDNKTIAEELVIYSGKITDHLKRALFYGKGKEQIESNKPEISFFFAQILCLCYIMLDNLGSSLEEAMDKNYRKLWEKRFKGKGKFSEDAVYNRDLESERKELES